MSCLSGSNKRARTAQVSVRMSPDDLRRVESEARFFVVSKPAFLLAVFYQWLDESDGMNPKHLTAACRGRSIKSR